MTNPADPITAVDSVAKAVDSVGQAATEGIKLLNRMIGEPAEQVAGVIADFIRRYRDGLEMRRIEGALQFTIKMQNNIRAAGLRDNRIPPTKVLMGILEEASIEEKDDLQQLWANLLTSAIDPRKDDVRMAYVSILKELEQIDAKVLNYMYSHRRAVDENGTESARILSQDIRNANSLHADDYFEVMDNLKRLELVDSSRQMFRTEGQPPGTPIVMFEPRLGLTELAREGHLYQLPLLTPLGMAFMRACTMTSQPD